MGVDKKPNQNTQYLQTLFLTTNNLAKQVSLAIIHSPQTKSRIDQNGLPAWTWRDGAGNNGYGGCVHIHPETGEPYLETQFPKNKRPLTPISPKGRKPKKYILFNHAGDWYGRVHHLYPVEWEENWQHPKAHSDGEVLLRDLAGLLGIAS